MGSNVESVLHSCIQYSYYSTVGLAAADDRTRAEHQFKFRAVGSSTQAFRNSFAVRTVGNWNSLPSDVVEQSTPASFKAELSRLPLAAYRYAP